jgi:ATP-binding cassette subfamily F protein 3
LDINATPLQIMERLAPQTLEQKRRAHLGRFGFQQDKALTKVSFPAARRRGCPRAHEPGDAARAVCWTSPPTISISTPGPRAGDQFFRGRRRADQPRSASDRVTADRLWLVAGGTVKSFDVDMDVYRKLLTVDAAADRRRNGDGTTRTAAGRKEQRRASAEQRAASAHLRKAAAEAEKRLEKLQQKKTALEARLADPEVYNGPTAKLMELQLRYGDLKREIETAEDAWLETQSALE